MNEAVGGFGVGGFVIRIGVVVDQGAMVNRAGADNHAAAAHEFPPRPVGFLVPKPQSAPMAVDPTLAIGLTIANTTDGDR